VEADGLAKENAFY